MKSKLPESPGLTECLEASGGTRALRAGNGVYREIPALLRAEYGSERVFLVADENTLKAAGGEFERGLSGAGISVAGRYIFPGEPRLHADYDHVKTLRQKIGTAGAPLVPVAVGAGTVNDLVKLAASELNLPYLCVPTAASVDGFTSYGSAILKDGYKQTMACEAPRCVVADTTVLSRAPAYLASSGFADLAGKVCAGADWIIADTVADFGAKGSERIEPKAWAMVQHGLNDFLTRSAAAAEGDEEALRVLFEALSMTGFSMQYLRSSRPVSGAEHLFAHIWEMENLSIDGNPVTHGHKVGIGSLAAVAFMEIVFADPSGPPPPPSGFRRPSPEERAAGVLAAFAGSPALEGVLKTSAEKFHDEKSAARISEGIRDCWKELRGKVLEQIIPYAEFKALFEKARCPVRPAEINLSRAAVIACARRAQMIRNRYIVLDLAWDLGCFETALARMEESESYLR
ncbi:MAG: sn-glycerol-1-phosphate dehydrogenase [Treponema sp.]|jgi:glycerol-1-phosphate dehydrogenase [NAD(P)+]|nr:sn-glycerol-1-phosphate dehydrogenase [Treponema sp.]